MSTWNLDFGIVQHWDDFKLKHETVQMKIEYDTGSTMPVKIDYFDNGKVAGTSFSINLLVKKIESPYGNIEICGELYSFTDEQISLINSVMPYWKCHGDNDTQTNNNTVIHLGFIL